MITSQKGQRLLQDREALRLVAYQDDAGVWTIGWGQTGPLITRGTTWSKTQAIEAFRQSLVTREATVNSLVKVPLTQNQFDALVSFVYNVGGANFKSSTLLRKLNAGDYYGAAKEFAVWNKVRIDGKLVVSNGLSNRRASEAAQFNEIE